MSKNAKTVHRFSITEDARKVAREIACCPMELTDVLGCADGFYLIFGHKEPHYHFVDDSEQCAALLTTVGEKCVSDILVGVARRLTVWRDKHGLAGIEYPRWRREWMAYV